MMAARIVSLHTMAGTSVADSVECAFSWVRRLRGLLGKDELTATTGLWIRPCRSIHTFGMRMAIDVVFLDDQLRVLRVCSPVPPGRIRIGPSATRSTLELKAGRTLAIDLRPGDELTTR